MRRVSLLTTSFNSADLTTVPGSLYSHFGLQSYISLNQHSQEMLSFSFLFIGFLCSSSFHEIVVLIDTVSTGYKRNVKSSEHPVRSVSQK